MFNLFGSKTKKERLESKYLRLTEKAFELDQIDVKAAAKIRRQAQMIMYKMVLLDKAATS